MKWLDNYKKRRLVRLFPCRKDSTKHCNRMASIRVSYRGSLYYENGASDMWGCCDVGDTLKKCSLFNNPEK